jgi:hypothetical protein
MIVYNYVMVGLILFTTHKERINILKVYTGSCILAITTSHALHHDLQYLYE